MWRGCGAGWVGVGGGGDAHLHPRSRNHSCCRNLWRRGLGEGPGQRLCPRRRWSRYLGEDAESRAAAATLGKGGAEVQEEQVPIRTTGPGRGGRWGGWPVCTGNSSRWCRREGAGSRSGTGGGRPTSWKRPHPHYEKTRRQGPGRGRVLSQRSLRCRTPGACKRCVGCPASVLGEDGRVLSLRH